MPTETDPSPAGGDRLQGNITAYWDLRGESYDTSERHGITRADERELWRPLLRQVFPAPPLDVLDIGAGTGFLALLLAELGHRVTALDPAEGMLAVARAKAAGMNQPPRFEVGDGHAPPFPAASFDVVTNRHVLWTLRDPAAAFAAWYAVLRPGGRVLAFDGLWAGTECAETADPAAPAWRQAYRQLYSEDVRGGLPLMHKQTLAPAVAAAEAAGFAEVRLERLTSLEKAEREHAGDGEWQPEPRFLLIGVRPAPSSPPPFASE